MKHKTRNMEDESGLIEKIVSLAKRRGFIFPGSEIYGGLAGTWDYGPLGAELKRNIQQLWWERFVRRRDDIVGLDSALLMNSKVWEASGHIGGGFSDPLVECRKCHGRFRLGMGGGAGSVGELDRFVQEIIENSVEAAVKKYPDAARDSWWKCESCGEKNDFTVFPPRQFNLMFQSFIGPVKDKASVVYLRPETAQGMFVNFKNILDSTRLTIPFGIAQIGRAFRNEIAPRNFIFRTREFEQMEIEYFVRERDWEKYFEHWGQEMREWIKALGILPEKIYEFEVPAEDRAHYSKRTIDFMYDFPFGRDELYGLAYRTDFDLRNHETHSGENLKYRDPDTGEEFWPHVIEPTWGVDRSVLAVLCEAYREEKDRVVLALPPKLAPYKAAVFPLLANKPQLVEKAQTIYRQLKTDNRELAVAWDDRGNIGKRYYSQDEIGTPWCVTVDFQTLEDDTVTVRDRDTMQQERMEISALKDFFASRLA